MNRPTMLHEAMLREFECTFQLPTTRDHATLLDRFEHEGLSFLTITLPSLGGALERALEVGDSTPLIASGFALAKGGKYPAFLQGVFSLVFDSEGLVRSDLSAEPIKALRQFFHLLKKMKVPCSDIKNSEAERRFIATDLEVGIPDWDGARPNFNNSDERYFTTLCALLWGPMFRHLVPESLVCKHGPGATAERKTASSRWQITNWYDRMSPQFPLDLHAIPNWAWSADLDGVEILSPEEEPPVRVVFVPKTQKTPRVIAIEPSCVQFAQQGLMDFVVPILESHPLTRGSVNFTDQSRNQLRCKEASVSRAFATLDLKDASDRVSLDLVKLIFANSDILPYLLACRSSRALTPSGFLVTLRKFASMGSAMCFPVEAMVFYTITLYSVMRRLQMACTVKNVLKAKEDVLVYGDDIIVPTDSVGFVIQHLEALGLRVNADKSFSDSYFRESCGADYWKGEDVRPIYLRKSFWDDEQDADDLQSLCATANQLYKAGWWQACEVLRQVVTSKVRRKIPYASQVARHLNGSSDDSAEMAGSGIYFFSYWRSTNLRYSVDLHRWEQSRYILSPLKAADVVPDSSCRLLLAFRNGGLNEIDFDRSVKRGVFKQKRRWVPVSTGNCW